MTKQPKNLKRKPRIIKLDAISSDISPAPEVKNTGKSAKKPSVKSTRKPAAQMNMKLVSRQKEPEITNAIEQLEVPLQPPKSINFSWGGMFFAALGGLLVLATGVALDQLIGELFARQSWLGWAASGLTVVLAIAAFAIVLREVWAISRLTTIATLRKNAIEVQSGERPTAGADIVRDLQALYSSRPDMARARQKFADDTKNVLDGEDLMAVFETVYMRPLDSRARTLVMQSAKRVSLVTAVSPRAIVDLSYVLLENTRLISRISALYGGRPGIFGFWKLTRNILAHLALTGAIAAGDSLLQQFVGHGIAARLSSKLGEGVINGLLTARIGLAAVEQARPLQFKAVARPSVSEYFTELTRSFSPTGATKPADKG